MGASAGRATTKRPTMMQPRPPRAGTAVGAHERPYEAGLRRFPCPARPRFRAPAVSRTCYDGSAQGQRRAASPVVDVRRAETLRHVRRRLAVLRAVSREADEPEIPGPGCRARCGGYPDALVVVGTRLEVGVRLGDRDSPRPWLTLWLSRPRAAASSTASAREQDGRAGHCGAEEWSIADVPRRLRRSLMPVRACIVGRHGRPSGTGSR